MGLLKKLIVGTVGTAAAIVAAPIVLPVAGAAAAAAAATAAAVGGAAVAGGATALGAAKLVVGGITVGKVLLGSGVVIGALLVKCEKAKTDGIKEGYDKASREYEEKLLKQAEIFFKQLKDAEDQIAQHKEDKEKAERVAEEAFHLVGMYEGCIRATEEKGENPLQETREVYAELKKVADTFENLKAA